MQEKLLNLSGKFVKIGFRWMRHPSGDVRSRKWIIIIQQRSHKKFLGGMENGSKSSN